MSGIENSETWHELLKQIIDIPIKRFPDEAYTDAEVKEILTTMRKRWDEASSNPKSVDLYQIDSRDYMDVLDIFQQMADRRGIVIS